MTISKILKKNKNIAHYFFGMRGGVSSGQFSSLNCGIGSLDKKKNVIKKFIQSGYSYNGFGIDHNNLDWLFIKKKSFWNNFVSQTFPYIHRIHYKRLNKLIRKF